MTKAEIRRNRNKRLQGINRRVLFGDAKKMALPISEGGTGYYYTTITRFLNEEDSFWTEKVAAAIEKWLDNRDLEEKKNLKPENA